MVREGAVGSNPMYPVTGPLASASSLSLIHISIFCPSFHYNHLSGYIPVSYTHLDVYKRQAQRYHRGYFSFTVDSMDNMLRMKKSQTDSIYFGIFKFQLPDSNSLELEGWYKSDTVKMKLTRMPRHFQLKEKQFHWLSEYNR